MRRRPLPDCLLLIRAAAGAFVVIFHVFISGIMTGSDLEARLRLGPLNLSWLLSGAGQAGVQMFFVLSGYLMGKAFYTRRYDISWSGAMRFYAARFLRIYPMLAFYILLMITLMMNHASTATETYATLGRVFLTEWHLEWGASFGKLGHLWSVLTEVRFYATVPFIALVLVRVAGTPVRARVALAFVVIAGLGWRAYLWSSPNPYVTDYSIVELHWNEWIRQPLSSNLDLFLSGMLLNYMKVRLQVKRTGSRLAAFLGGVMIFYVVAAFISHYALFGSSVAMKTLWAVGLPTITILATLPLIHLGEAINADGGFTLPRRFDVPIRCAAHCGSLTYGIYLWHLPFVGTPLPFSRPFGFTGNVLFADLLTYGLAVIVAQVVHLGIEEPTDRLRHVLFTRRASTTAGLRSERRPPVPEG